ncbi:hypothetical protein [Variovorax rhizosphaerae]|uniref:Uncharacterized protein n=1 Tax=Variovorax rhizosphaerae TaxID=1836200 RepID=A0ABU8WUG7_9BURK
MGFCVIRLRGRLWFNSAVCLFGFASTVLAQTAAAPPASAPARVKARDIQTSNVVPASCMQAVASCIQPQNQVDGPSPDLMHQAYEKLFLCLRKALVAQDCTTKAVTPGEIEQMRTDTAALVTVASGATCAPPAQAKIPEKCLPEDKSASATSPVLKLRRLEQRTALVCNPTGAEVCNLLILRDLDGTGQYAAQQYVVRKGRTETVFLDSLRDKFCIAPSAEAKFSSDNCTPLQLPATMMREGQLTMNFPLSKLN